MAQVRPAAAGDRKWIEATLACAFGAARMALRGRLMNPAEHAGFITADGGSPVGFVTYEIRGRECEITSIVAVARQRGIGSLLLRAVLDHARASGCSRLRVVTTNDNLSALRFYQRRGFSIACVHRGAVDSARRDLKPEIPLTGESGIPLRDEIELEMRIP